MKTWLVAAASAAVLATGAVSAQTMTFSGVGGSLVQQATYTEAGITATSIEGYFWGFPSGAQLHLDPAGFGNSTYDFTLTSGGTFSLNSIDVSYASTGAIGTFTAFNAANTLIGTAAFSAAATGVQTFSLSGITRLRLVDTGNHFSIDRLVLGAGAVAAVPEPATWAMMLVGFGAVGAGLRRRAKVRAAIARA